MSHAESVAARKAARLAVLAVALLAFVTAQLRAQDNSDSDKAPRNYFSFEVGYVGNARSVKVRDGIETTSDIEFHDRFTGVIEVRPERTAGGGVTWFPRGDSVLIDGAIEESITTVRPLAGEGDVKATETRVASYKGHPTGEANLVNALIQIRSQEKTYDMQFMLMPDMASTMEAVLETQELKTEGAPSLGGGKRTQSSRAGPLNFGPGQMVLNINNYAMVVDVKGAPLGEGNVLTGTRRILLPKPASWSGSWNLAMEVTWKIDVSLPPVELVITADNYAEWRPEGSIKKPQEPGNSLTARATLRSKVGGVSFLPEVKQIRFQLLDTSREPGVCLNWPLGAKDNDYDLRLAAPAGGTLSKSDQVLEITSPKRNDEGQPYAEARIDSYDFGGRASLRAVCLLADGREIEGVMKGEGETPRLPKMKGAGWIAESWRKTHHVENLPDDDDSEKVDGQKDNGDGFTLYEEYRGWVVNGKHVEGDPTKKDFFVLNLIGADARNGIGLFEKLSQLRVHSKLRRSEMSETTRLMNGNHRDAPHRVDQHGVWVKTFTRAGLGDNGADTPMTKAGVAGRPGITKGVGILARGDTESIFNKPFNLPARDTIFAYDRAIAHELLHSVGVEHHGSGDYQQILGYVSPRNPYNKVGRPYYASDPKASPTVVLDEAGHDLATKDYPDYVKFRQLMDMLMLERELADGRAYLARNGVGWNGIETAEQYADSSIEILIVFCFMHLNGNVGVQQGAHSGDQDCLMRYYFAKFYEATGRKDTLYVATPGTERIGIDICHAGTGTGINAAGHKPQSRYGNAAAGEGDCFSQICPNDAIPPRKTK